MTNYLKLIKTAIGDAVKELKEAHGEKDFARMEAATAALNAAWQAASTEMYQADQAAGANGAEEASPEGEPEVTDVEYEEVDDAK